MFVPLMMNKNTRKPMTLRVSPETAEMLEAASEAAQLTKTKIIEECVNRYASEFVEAFLEERKKQFAEFSKTVSSKNK